MQTHLKKKLDVIVEAALVEHVVRVLDRLGAHGYTVLPAIAGSGREGPWQAGELSSASSKLMVVVVADEALARQIMDEVFALVKDYKAILYLSDVEVLRSDRF